MTAARRAEQVALWKEQGLKVGFTNGCFDLLHRGHLYSLEQAARRVDRLVVGVNSDASAARLKGPGRPVQDLADARRGARGAPLRRPRRALRRGHAGGADQGAQPGRALQGRRLCRETRWSAASIVKANGGRVELLPLLPGHSTTGTVKRLRGEA